MIKLHHQIDLPQGQHWPFRNLLSLVHRVRFDPGGSREIGDAIAAAGKQHGAAFFWKAVRVSWHDGANALRGPLFDSMIEQFTATPEGLAQARELMMCAQARALFNSLPDELIVYRGALEGKAEEGRSWSLRREVALFYATNWSKGTVRTSMGVTTGQPVLLSGRIRKDHIFWVMTEGGHSEIVTPPGSVGVLSRERVAGWYAQPIDIFAADALIAGPKTATHPLVVEHAPAVREAWRRGYSELEIAAIARAITADQFQMHRSPLHGVGHWGRVLENGLRIAADVAAADVRLVQLFAVLHDSERVREYNDPAHGANAAQRARRMCAAGVFDIPSASLEKLCFALARHECGECSDDPTIGACWDADRLEIQRFLGREINCAKMSTTPGQDPRVIQWACVRALTGSVPDFVNPHWYGADTSRAATKAHLAPKQYQGLSSHEKARLFAVSAPFVF